MNLPTKTVALILIICVLPFTYSVSLRKKGRKNKFSQDYLLALEYVQQHLADKIIAFYNLNNKYPSYYDIFEQLQEIWSNSMCSNFWNLSQKEKKYLYQELEEDLEKYTLGFSTAIQAIIQTKTALNTNSAVIHTGEDCKENLGKKSFNQIQASINYY